MTTILSETRDKLGIITFNRPDKYNSFNWEMTAAFNQALIDFDEDEEIRAIIITGKGNAFCTGQNLQDLSSLSEEQVNNIVHELYNPMILKLMEVKVPVIAAVNGVAAGAGANIALNCDIVLASESASFIQAFSKIGLVPDCGGSYILPRLIGEQKALSLMITGDAVSAIEAEKMGMIYKAVKAEMFEEEVNAFATKIANMPTQALKLTKQLVRKSSSNSLSNQLSMEGDFQRIASKTEDFREGVTAFMEKRKPEFKGK